MKVAIYSRVLEDSQQKDLQLFFDELEKLRIEPMIFIDYYEEIKDQVKLPENTSTFFLSEDLTDAIDFIISLGGDGTLLDTVTLVRNKNIPVMGINFGRLGFLASIGRDEMEIAVNALMKRTMVIDKRVMIHLDSNIPLFGHVP